MPPTISNTPNIVRTCRLSLALSRWNCLIINAFKMFAHCRVLKGINIQVYLSRCKR